MSCRSCGAALLWLDTSTGKKMPVDAQPHPEGNIQVVDGTAKVLGKETAELARENGEALHRSHFATCPGAAAHRKPR